MTQKEFDALPGLLTRAELRAATGLSDNDIRQLKGAGEAKGYVFEGRKLHKGEKRKTGVRKRRMKYYKWWAAEMAGFKM